MELQYTLLGLLLGILILNIWWSTFVAFPMALEKHLKSGKTWVYIPISWTGARKTQVRWVSRLFVLVLAALSAYLLGTYLEKTNVFWFALFSALPAILLFRFNAWLRNIRFRQQEDAYFLVHDTLSHKLKSEGKDIRQSTFRNLASYQHQSFLRKADEKGKLIRALGTQAKASRKMTFPRPDSELAEFTA